MKKIVLVILLTLASCGGQLTQQETDTAVTVAQSVLDLVANVLLRAEDKYLQCQSDLSKTFECAELNDAILYVKSRRKAYQNAVDYREQYLAWQLEDELWAAAKELERELEGF